MLDFRPLELSDKQWIDELVFAEGSKSADFNFGNRYLWDKFYSRLITRCRDRIVSKIRSPSSLIFDFPIGKGELAPVIEIIWGYSQLKGFPLCIRGITPKHKSELERLFPRKFRFELNRNQFDYVYSAKTLSTLTGKKLHGKRNHINRFTMNNDWSFEPLAVSAIPECLELLDAWTEENRSKHVYGIDHERVAILRGFDNFEALKLEGGVLRVNGRVVAFTVGEAISADTFDVHFEKAVDGAYPVINREFASLILERYPNILYINREDDMGLPNLRKAKQSYAPEFMVEKYTARWE